MGTHAIIKNKNKGFTLVELIVVVVILGILAAIAVPSLVGYIDKSRSAGTIAECRQLVVAAQTLASERHAEGKALEDGKLDTSNSFYLEVSTLGEKPSSGILEYMTFGGSVLTELLYTNNGQSVLYKNGEYTVVGSSDGSSTPTAPPSDTYKTYVLDPATGKYVEIEVKGTGIGSSNAEINKKIIYYEGGRHGEAGYYYIYAWQYMKSINNMDDYLDIITQGGTRYTGFVKMNPDAPITTYDPATQTGHSQKKDDNTSIVQGQIYYVDLQWDDVDGPVMAMYTGGTGDAWWRGDLTSTDTWPTNAGVWTVLNN